MSDFNFKLKTRSNKSGRSVVCSDGRKFSVISGHLGLAVNVMNRSGAPYLARVGIESAHRSLMFPGDPSNDEDRSTGIPVRKSLVELGS
ncbi:hypothetical protein AVEN_169484-1 [Araneus ventricosus]|uniref:Uncharacterized protein n=1 Tax=Araneus ventricosus TaxID=182803 RepID=A0A4Y2LL09_ARAVE|nr:hypothetical protein AVEN_169484-1 [Araneus ventricosus]